MIERLIQYPVPRSQEPVERLDQKLADDSSQQ